MSEQYDIRNADGELVAVGRHHGTEPCDESCNQGRKCTPKVPRQGRKVSFWRWLWWELLGIDRRKK